MIPTNESYDEIMLQSGVLKFVDPYQLEGVRGVLSSILYTYVDSRNDSSVFTNTKLNYSEAEPITYEAQSDIELAYQFKYNQTKYKIT